MFNTTTSFKEQKKLTKFSIILLFSIFLLYGCQSKNDPFKNVNFGKVSTEEFKNDMFNQKIFTEQYEDSTGFRYFVNNGQEKLPVTAVINPDGFKLGKLRQLKIYLSGDTSYMGFYKTDDTTEHISKMFSPGFGPKKITEVNSIIEIYKDWYGEPDSIKYFYQRRTDYIDTTDFGQVSYYKHLKINTDTFQSEEEYDTTNILGIDAVYWHTDKYNIRVNLDFPKKNRHFDSSLVYEGYYNYIIYEIPNYNKRLNAIRDSIRKTLTDPNDFIFIKVQSPKWKNLYPDNNSVWDTKFSIYIQEIGRKDKGGVEFKGITDIKYDIVLTDKFDAELYRYKNIIYEPESPLWSGIEIQSNITFMGYGAEYSIKYWAMHNNNIDIEEARAYAKTNKIKVFADIKAVVFEDGSMIKK